MYREAAVHPVNPVIVFLFAKHLSFSGYIYNITKCSMKTHILLLANTN